MNAPAPIKIRRAAVPAKLPYLDELVAVMTDNSVRKMAAVNILKRRWTVGNNMWFVRLTNSQEHWEGSSHISCVFGELSLPYDGPSVPKGSLEERINIIRYKREYYIYWGRRSECGIEILGAQPNAKGTTYSRSCRITIKKLKEACKTNGIKTAGLDKKGLLSALMKV
jgi:hypothetical protein